MEGGVTVTSHHLQAHLHVGEIEEVVDVLRRRVFVVGDKKLQDKKISVNVTSSKTQSEAIRIGPGPRCAALTFVPLNTSLAMFLHASTTPSPFISRAMTGPSGKTRQSNL